MEIKAPKTIDDLRIRHLKTLQNSSFENLSDDMPFSERLDLMVEFVSGICSVEKNKVYRIDINDLKKIYIHCTKLFDSVQVTEPKKQIEINGKKYKIVDPHTVSSGWHADFSKSDIDKDPVRVACLMYIPDDGNYSELDETGNLKDKISDRYKDFEEHFKLVDFMGASRFFLQNWFLLTNELERRLRLEKRVKGYLRKIGFNGKTALTH